MSSASQTTAIMELDPKTAIMAHLRASALR